MSPKNQNSTFPFNTGSDDPLRSFCESNGLSDMVHKGLISGKVLKTLFLLHAE